ncbi:MAG: CHASE2 domain-containing protein [Cyanobacteria bacterium P01_F01_bin.13]
MNPLVVLNLGKGNCQTGLPTITAQLWLENDTVPMQYTGSLPAAADLPQLYRRWQQLYKALHKSFIQRISADDSIEFEANAVTNVSMAEFRQLSEQLQAQINGWLNSDGFRNIDQQLRTRLNPQESIRFIIEAEDPILQKLPWHLWRFFDHYNNAEAALSAQQYERVPSTPTSRVSRPMRVLVVLGHSDGIDTQRDRIMLEDANAETVVLAEPKRKDLDQSLRDETGWDILFFAGHSTSEAVDEVGEIRDQIFLNPREKLSISQLKYAFKQAIDNGLKLVIFNSCDGLGLARELAELNLPQLIAMREPITDQVAHIFLKNFLQAFACGETFYTAVRHAREKLQALESDLPGASWMPVIYQNPTEGLFLWRTLPKPETTPAIIETTPVQKPDQTHRRPVKLGRRLILSMAMVMAAAMGGLRNVGVLQSVELSAYDHLMRARPSGWDQPVVDNRLLVVELTDETTDQYGYPISDDLLAKALGNLKQHQPVTIGIDLHRYQPNLSGRENLLNQFNTFPTLITVCSFGWGDREILGHPPEFSDTQAHNQVGFSDLETDDNFQRGRSVVRRQLLSYDNNLFSTSSNCTTPYSFSLILALRFLQAQGVQPLSPNGQNNWQLGAVVFERLAAHTGGYQRLDGDSSQILLNYRFMPRPAQRVSFMDVLEGKVNQDLVRDRVVLIGITDQLGNDFLDTPYGELPGVWVHAHGVSQVLAAVLDNRSLMWVLPQWGWFQWADLLWIWGWAVVGGLLVWRIRSILVLGVSGVVVIFGLRQICLLILTQGGWVPFVPTLLAFVGTAGVLFARKHMLLSLDVDTPLNSLTWKRSR